MFNLHAGLRSYFCSKHSSELSQLLIAFVIGLLLGPFSSNLLLRVIFLVLYVAVIYYFTRGEKPYWRALTRLAIISISLYGYFLGRWLTLDTTGLEGRFAFRELA